MSIAALLLDSIRGNGSVLLGESVDSFWNLSGLVLVRLNKEWRDLKSPHRGYGSSVSASRHQRMQESHTARTSSKPSDVVRSQMSDTLHVITVHAVILVEIETQFGNVCELLL
jgi:hypothetical protein